MRRTIKGLASAAVFYGALTAIAGAQNSTDDWKWVVDFSSRHNGWDTACDHHMDRAEKRCYIRYVDVYAPRPRFGAAFVFVQWDEAGRPYAEFAFEPGTRFTENGFALSDDGSTVWRYDTGRCDGTLCRIEGDAAAELFGLFEGDRQLELRFSDRHGRDWERIWSTAGFAAALDDFHTQSQARGLPGN